MSDFQNNYNELIKYAVFLLKKYSVGLQPEELINEAYIKNYDKNFSLQDFKKSMLGFLLDEYYLATSITNIDKPQSIRQPKEDMRCCKVCHELFPINAFRIQKTKYTNYIKLICLACEAKDSAIRQNYQLHKSLLSDHFIKRRIRNAKGVKAKDMTIEMIYNEKIKLLFQKTYKGNVDVLFLRQQFQKARQIIEKGRPAA